MISFYFYNFRGNAVDTPERRPIDPQALSFARGLFKEVAVSVSGTRKWTICKKAGGICIICLVGNTVATVVGLYKENA